VPEAVDAATPSQPPGRAARRTTPRRALADDALRFRLLAIGGVEGTLIVDDRGIILAANERAGELLGRDVRTLTDAPLGAFIDSASQATARLRISELSDTPFGLNIRGAEGTTAACEARVTVVQVARRRYAVFNVLERSRVQTIYDRHPNGISVVDQGMACVEANETLSNMLGYSREEFLAMSSIDLVPMADRELYTNLHAAMFTGQLSRYTVDKRLLTKAGSVITCRVTCVALRDDDGVVRFELFTFEDLTDQRRLEAELDRRRGALPRSDSLLPERSNRYGLTSRERTILLRVANGETDKQIGTALRISSNTVQKHLANIFTKMRVSSRTEAAVKALRERLIG
jgi:PAS domain S-box-containing protein